MLLVAKEMASTRFGAALRRLRDAAGLSQSVLGERVGMGRDKIARLETSPDANPTLETICKLALALNCAPSELIDSCMSDPASPPKERKKKPDG